MSVATLDYLKSNFVVLHGNNFVRHKSLLDLNLRRALRVETKEASGELDRVLKVSLDLSDHCVSNNALLLLVGDDNTAK